MNDTQRTIAGALLIGGSLATGNAALITAAGGIGVNWTSEGLQGVRRSWRNRKLETPLSRAYSAAIRSAVARLRTEYTQRDGSATKLNAFDLVAECADDLANAEFPPVRMDADAAQLQLAVGLDGLLHGHEAGDFLKERLMSATALALRDALAADGEAWMRFHGWLIEDLRANLIEISVKFDRVTEVLTRFADPALAFKAMMDSLMRIEIAITSMDKRTERIEDKLDKALSKPPASGPTFNNEGMRVAGNVFQTPGAMYIGSTHIDNKGGVVNIGAGGWSSVQSSGIAQQPIDKVALKAKLVQHFDKSDLDGLCFAVQQRLAHEGHLVPVTLDIVGGDGLPERCQRLIEYLDRRGVLMHLVDEARRQRSHVEWR